MRFFCLICLLLTSVFGFSQVPDQEELSVPREVAKDTINKKEFSIRNKIDTDTLIKVNDLYYREDQFYLNLTYNLLQDRDHGISQNAFSAGFNVGFLRDVPLNKRRNVAVALGVGYSFSNYRTNMYIAEVDGDIQYSIAEDFDKSKMSLHYLEVPIEFRWRTSTPKNIKFWRIYTGFKVSFLTYSRSKVTGNFATQTVTNNPDIQKVRYGMYLAVGHGNLNFYACYSLSPLFDNAYIDGKPIELTSLNLGLIFYLL